MKRMIATRAKFALSVCGVLLLCTAVNAQTVVSSFAPPPVSPAPPEAGVWFESDVRTGGTASIVDLTGAGGNLEGAQPLPTGSARLTTDFVSGQDKAEVAVADNYHCCPN